MFFLFFFLQDVLLFVCNDTENNVLEPVSFFYVDFQLLVFDMEICVTVHLMFLTLGGSIPSYFERDVC